MKSGRRAGPPILPAGVSAALLMVLIAIGVVGALRMKVVKDISSLLPSRDSKADLLVELSRQSGMMRKVVVVVGPAASGSEKLFRAVDRLEVALKATRGVKAVTSRVDSNEARRAAEVIFGSAARLFRRHRGKIDPAEVKGRLDRLRSRLAAPEAILMQEYMLKDPLGFGVDALLGIEAASKSIGAVPEQGYLLSSDRRFALLILDIDFDPLDVDQAQSFVERLDRDIAGAMSGAGANGPDVFALGGVHYSASNGAALKADVKTAFAATSLLVLAICWIFFGRIRVLAAALIPGGAGIAAGLGSMALAGEDLHALTLGFAATVTGISVDYAIHLLYQAVSDQGPTTRERMSAALGRVTRPVVLGCLTTVVAFLIVSFSSFTGIRQLARFAAVSVPVALLVTLFVLPAFHGLLLGRRSAQLWWTRMHDGFRFEPKRIHVVPIFAVFFGAFAWFGSRVALSGDPRDLAHRDESIESREHELKSLFPGLANQALIVAFGKTLEDALQSNDAMYDRLAESGVDRADVVSVSPFLPSIRSQERSLASVGALLKDRRIKEAFIDSGFTASYFERLQGAIDVRPLTLRSYDGTGLFRILSEAVQPAEGGWHVLTRVRAADDATVDRLSEISGSVSGCDLASERLVARDALETLHRELLWTVLIWLCAGLPLLWASQRSLRFALQAVVPALMGVACAVGLFGMIGRPLTPVASAAITLVMGLGIDYGIFMQSRSKGDRSRPSGAVLASALTTIAAFGVLAFARVRSMSDLGIIILTGVSVAVVTALVLLPALSRRGDELGASRTGGSK